MGKFDGYLICSDWDGTLFNNGDIPKRNVDAIRYFQENGGLFTVSSGRYPDFVKQYESFVKPNTYLIGLNGALIVEPDSGEVFYTDSCGYELIDCLVRFIHKAPFYSQVLLYPIGGQTSDTMFLSVDDFLNNIPKYKNARYYKALLKAETVTEAELGRRVRDTFEDETFEIVSSWIYSLEFCKKSCNKATAVKRIKEATNSKVLICAGNYENDFSMLDVADIAYVVGDSDANVKSHADKITCDAKDGAIADIIEDIERNLRK